MSATDKIKLDGIDIDANKYVHPSDHPATMITEDADHRFVTDDEKTAWNAKAETDVATLTEDGLMSYADKVKMDGIEAEANKYAHPDHSGDVTSTGDGVTVIGDNKVSNAKLADMATQTVKGRVSAGAGDPEDLTVIQLAGMIPVATQAGKGLMSAEDKTKLDALGSGGSSVMLTLVHTTIPSSTTATAYEVLATGQIVGRSDWYMPELSVLLRRSGSGQVRLSLSDGTTTITAETSVFAGVGTNKLTLDTSTLIDGVAWDLTVEALSTTGTVTVDRLKIMADPVNEFAPPLVGSGTGNSTNSTSWAELGTSTFLPTWLDVDGRGGVILLADVDLGTATGADIRITIGTESVTQAVAFSGVVEIHCPFPSVPSAIMSAKIEGKVTGGSGTIALSHWQLHIEK
ncbi:hypothetical protein L2W58_08015 [Dethiosulfovibrio sp. F2B]|uniref:hypothetical protein n=1 Tax=Dethiosulfovibrio faecalis TaxID=2720018 RepID=UPI001F18FE6A|nr:hypothetical protein [Dethiosulfovibrio faecalis]MCF4151746.1 hypothetical protein [Dethiosulfovibrio faecalis]